MSPLTVYLIVGAALSLPVIAIQPRPPLAVFVLTIAFTMVAWPLFLLCLIGRMRHGRR